MDGRSQRSRNGQAMFTDFNSKTPFSRLRFDIESLASPLGGGGGLPRFERDYGLRFGMPADSMMDEALQSIPPVPRGYVDRLHMLVDELAEDTAA